ncbi:MAG: murein biosynthesis integral membrane protein MurJ [Chloroflexota bacterium]
MTSPHAANRQIARSAGTVMIALALSQISNLVFTVLSARAFGAGHAMDVFAAANRVPETLFKLMAAGALGSAFIPTFAGLLTRDERQTAWKLASAIANLLFVGVSLAAVLAGIFAQPLVRYLLAPGFAADPALEAQTIHLMRLMLPSAVVFSLSGLVMGILNAHRVFFIPALTPSMYRLGLIFGVLFLAPRMGVEGLAWGVLLGASMHLLCQLPSLWRLKGAYIPSFGLKLPAVRAVGRLMLPRLFGVAVVELNFWVNANLASRMAAGSIIGLNWAFMIMLMPQAVIAQAVATAALPTLSAQYALGKLDDVRASLAASLRGILLLAFPAALGLILLRQAIVALMLQYGNFDRQDTDIVAWALLWYAAGLVGHCVVEILARAFYALHDTKTPVLVGAAAMGLNAVLSVAFARGFAQIGWLPHGGLALANSLATALEAAGLIVLMRQRLNGLHGRSVLALTARAALAALAMGGMLWAWLSLSMPAWLLALGGVALGGAVYLLATWLLGVDEVHRAGGIVLRRVGISRKR